MSHVQVEITCWCIEWSTVAKSLNSISSICWGETNQHGTQQQQKKKHVATTLHWGIYFGGKVFPIHRLFASLFHYNLFKRFVEPFSDLIHSWEKTLSLIYEIIDQWVNFTQRKWLYLEGIFVDNDARIKLPTIAAKFDLIDSDYIKVHIQTVTLFFCL